MPKYPILSKIVGAVEKEEAPLLSKLGQAAEEVELNPDTMQALRGAGATLEETAPLTASMAESMDLQKMQNLRDIAAASEAAKSTQQFDANLTKKIKQVPVGEQYSLPFKNKKMNAPELIASELESGSQSAFPFGEVEPKASKYTPANQEEFNFPESVSTNQESFNFSEPAQSGTQIDLSPPKMGEPSVSSTTKETTISPETLKKGESLINNESSMDFANINPKMAATLLAAGVITPYIYNKLKTNDANKMGSQGGDGTVALGPRAFSPFDKKPESLTITAPSSTLETKPEVTAPAQEKLAAGTSPMETAKSISRPSEVKGAIDFSGDIIGTDEQLQAAQAAKNQNILLNRLGMAASQIGAGIAKAEVPSLEGFKQGLELAGQPVEDLKARIENQKNDPNSAVSKGYRDLMKRFGVTIKGNPTAASLEKAAPWLEKVYIADEQRKQRAFDAEQNRLTRMAALQVAAENRKAEREEKEDLAKKNLAKRQLERLKDKAIGGGGPVATAVRQRIVQADNIFNTAGVDPNITEEEINKIDPSKLDDATKLQIVESAIETNKLLSGQGAPAASQLNKLLAKSGVSDFQSAKSYFTNKPEPAKQGEFLRQILKMAYRVKKSSLKTNQEYVQKYLAGSSHIKEQLPEDYQEFLDSIHAIDPEEYAKQQKTSTSVEMVRVRMPNGTTGSVPKGPKLDALKKLHGAVEI